MPQEPRIVRSFSQKVPVFSRKVPLFRTKQGDFFRMVHCRCLSLLVRMSGRRYINKESVKLSATLAADSGRFVERHRRFAHRWSCECGNLRVARAQRTLNACHCSKKNVLLCQSTL